MFLSSKCAPVFLKKEHLALQIMLKQLPDLHNSPKEKRRYGSVVLNVGQEET
jgi:hypothetical protein